MEKEERKIAPVYINGEKVIRDLKRIRDEERDDPDSAYLRAVYMTFNKCIGVVYGNYVDGRPYGYWLDFTDENGKYKCSSCNKFSVETTNFCPHCGEDKRWAGSFIPICINGVYFDGHESKEEPAVLPKDALI